MRLRLNLRWKLTALLLVVIILMFTGVGVYAVRVMHSEVIEAAQEKLKSDLELGWAYLDLRYPGPWEIRDGKLYKGETLMNGNFEVVDTIGKITGDTVTIFQGNTRVATNVMKDGKRAVGTKVSPEVEKAVLKEGRLFIGKANVVGTWNQTAYKPIRDSSGKIIGIWYVGVPNTIYDQMAADFATKIVLFALGGIVLGIIVSWFFASYVCKPIQKLGAAMEQAQEGDFTVRTNFQPHDELGVLGQQFDKMLELLSDLIRKVVAQAKELLAAAQQLSQGADEAAKVTNQIATTIEQVASGTDNQVKNIEETTNRINDVTQKIKQVAANAETVASAADQAGGAAESGKTAIEKAISQMNTISETVNLSAATVKTLGERSQEIGQIVAVITGIADQTNLLALNAAIEAARAGEQGRGFAVVAEEVRKLAEQSAEAAKQISGLIREIQEETEKAVQEMEAGTEEVKNGIAVVQEAGTAFNRITSEVENVVKQIKEAAFAVQEIAAAADQAAAAVENIASIAQETAASAEEVAAATEEQNATMEELAASASTLHEIATQLQELTARFKLSE
ncbi:MAG: Methyl-accepting chemotaxis protein TlpC [Thermoanaerobacterales bacterium 50_218]|nr:MAG: Methyl-accepting chemotaxis protein TlpC [Thermoanaerobacterales bacterium 50_218]HAA90336.1 methyl-accepting chemotaxis protein [Peptococcaceae bacterium]